MRVAVTRAEEGTLTAHLEALGHHVVHVPLISVGPPADDGRALRAALGRLDRYRWLVVTSGNGARAAGPAAAEHPGVLLAAVGVGTASVLAELAGRPADLVPAVERAAGLVAEWPVDDHGPALLALADRAAPTLVDGLRARGVVADVVEAYRTTLRTPPANEIDAVASADVILLASGSAAQSLAALELPETARRGIVAIGPTTAAVGERVGLTVSAVAASPHDGDVIAALLAGRADR